jgi:hypothetical protein
MTKMAAEIKKLYKAILEILMTMLRGKKSIIRDIGIEQLIWTKYTDL